MEEKVGQTFLSVRVWTEAASPREPTKDPAASLQEATVDVAAGPEVGEDVGWQLDQLGCQLGQRSRQLRRTKIADPVWSSEQKNRELLGGATRNVHARVQPHSIAHRDHCLGGSKKRLLILGSTGSIGTQALDVVERVGAFRADLGRSNGRRALGRSGVAAAGR